MKNMKKYLLCTALITIVLFFGGFYFFADNINSPVNKETFIPFENVYMYQLLENGDAAINIIHIFMYSLVLAIPVFILFKLLGNLLKRSKV
ncbi:hypothetical protein D3H55_15350 [Bacillus salacetis]|uniref:Uncharacterized protein n=1 Tax=Bacillus salacetis TaxID=2315464 RepID=A0A3A1QU02_9BACI|nr:hypothetical protein [Bacillus salacetis]RIW31347.1 hypothetical protein D3H55_15350 [Bacillus salacetis]